MTSFAIETIYNISGIGSVPVGKIVQGVLRIGMVVNLDGNIMHVKSIEMNHNQLQEAKVGDVVGLILTLQNRDLGFFKRIFSNPLKAILQRHVGKTIKIT